MSKIARDKFVYSIKGGAPNPKADRRDVQISLTNIHSASTITGFCDKHDNELFTDIEDQAINIESSTQMLLVGFRAICRELHVKHIEKQVITRMKSFDQGWSFQKQFAMQGMASAWLKSVDAALEDVVYNKRHYDRALKSQDLKRFRYYALELDKIPDVVCTGSTYPAFDFCDRQLLNLHLRQQLTEMITFTIIPVQNKGIVAFTWFEDEKHSASASLIKSLDKISEIDRIHAIIRYLFNNFENFFLSPCWWEALSVQEKGVIKNRIRSDTELFDFRVPLKTDDLRIVDWGIVRTVSTT